MVPKALLLSLLFAVSAMAAGLDDVREIDIVRIAKEDGQVHLYLVLAPDQSVAQPAVLAKVRKKLDAYRFYVTSGQVWKNEAGSNSSLPVVLTVLITERMTPQEQSALDSLRADFHLGPTAYSVEHMPVSSRSKR